MPFSVRILAPVALTGWQPASRAADPVNLTLAADQIRIEWTQFGDGWRVAAATIRPANGAQSLGTPSGEYGVLFSATEHLRQATGCRVIDHDQSGVTRKLTAAVTVMASEATVVRRNSLGEPNKPL